MPISHIVSQHLFSSSEKESKDIFSKKLRGIQRRVRRASLSILCSGNLNYTRG